MINKNFKKGSDNIFADMGLNNPDDRLAKADIASKIYDIIQEKKLIRKEMSKILNAGQTDVSALVSGRLKIFSIKRLSSYLRVLDQYADAAIHQEKRRQVRFNPAYAA